MKKIFVYLLFAVLAIVSNSQFLFAQDCEKKLAQKEKDILMQNNLIENLRNQINAKDKQLAEEEVAYDTLNQRFIREKQLRISVENQLITAYEKIKELQKKLTTETNRVIQLTTEQLKLQEKIKKLEVENATRSKQYENLLNELNNTNLSISTITFQKEASEQMFVDSQKLITTLTTKKNILEEEEKDKISLSTKKVYFKEGKYDFEQEIFFIKAVNTGSAALIIDDKTITTLKRFAKLIYKYDYKVKISLKGQSSDADRADRNDLAESRAKWLIDYLTNQVLDTDNPDYKFNKDQFIDKKLALKETVSQSEIGVSVRIIKK